MLSNLCFSKSQGNNVDFLRWSDRGLAGTWSLAIHGNISKDDFGPKGNSDGKNGRDNGRVVHRKAVEL